MAQSDTIQLNTFRSIVNMLGDPAAKDEIKLKAAQELSEHFEVIIQSANYPSFLEHFLKVVMRVLQDGEPQFIQENTMQHVRKYILEMIHRLPISENLRQHVKPIISLMLKILRIDNEENVLVSLRIIIELHKHFRPLYNPEEAWVQQFLQFVKEIYTKLPEHLNLIFMPTQQICLKDLKELNIEHCLTETFASKPIHVEAPKTHVYNLLPKGVLSLRVLQELPIIVVLMYQIYKNAVHQEVAEFLPLIMTTINLQPTLAQRQSPFFNKEIFVDFMGAQIKTLSFLAYIVRIYQDVVMAHAPAVTSGMLSLMQLCPKEAAHLRKELLIAARHIFATELRQKFIGSIDKLFDEELLIGKGVTLDSIRPLAYSTLADLAHHVRQSLSLDVLDKAVNLFSKNVHDETLATGIQTMSCKLLLNLVDCIRQHSDNEPAKARRILTTLLKVFAYKFKSIAKINLPQLVQRCNKLAQANSAALAGSHDCKDGPSGSGAIGPGLALTLASLRSQAPLDPLAPDPSSKTTAAGSQWLHQANVAEYRSLVKTLVGGVKTITWGFISSKFHRFLPQLEGEPNKQNQEKLFKPSELAIYIDLVYWAMEALDIYTINTTTPAQQRPSGPVPRTKEEKEVLEHFSGIFLMMHAQNFQEVFATTIDFMVERIFKNPSLQVVANSFLANPTTSPLFATVLVEYLLNKMDEMGTNLDRSNLYLRLFKLVFGSVSLFPVENEQMLRPHLHNIVNRSMELAMTAEEPYNYFLLLRALFRSIGGGSHDLLYQEFLPLLPNLLEGLNRLQSGFHKQHMKDLFVELCLTVPVRLSSLLPYLPMLMDPLVSALNGSPTLISQGLRTLELCVDNLQPDFLYDHIQPVRAALMQALWKTLRSQDNAALVAFRVLGKFGGGNRKMMIEPQVLRYLDAESTPTAIITHFQDHERAIDFPIDRTIESAFNALSLNATDMYYRRQSWEVIRCYLAATINLDDDKQTLQKLFMHPSFTERKVSCRPVVQSKPQEALARKTHQTALTGMLVASATKDLRDSVCPVMVAVVRHYTMVAIAQQAGSFACKDHQTFIAAGGIDPLVLIDALAVCMGHEEKELCKPGQACIDIILQTATSIMGNKDRACRLPLVQYLAEKMTSLCYERPWYAKMGGCEAIQFLYTHMSLRALYQHLFPFLKAFLFVLMDLEGEVSNGAIATARRYMRTMLEICMTPLGPEFHNGETEQVQAKASYEVVHELVRQVTSSNYLVRQESMSSLRYIGELQQRTVSEIMDPHKEVLVELIPPKKLLLRHQPANAQIGLMDGNTFCTTLEPRLFAINLSNSYHRLFFLELLTLSEAEDAMLTKLDCYKNVSNLIPLRKSALRALASCHYIPDAHYRDKILNILFKLMESNKPELQEEAFHCMRTFISGIQMDTEKVHAKVRPLLLMLGDPRNLSLSVAKRLSYFTQLFPQMFKENLSEHILQRCQAILEVSVANYKNPNQSGNFFALVKGDDDEQKVVTLIDMFHQITAASPKYINSLCELVLQTERSLMIESCSPYRVPLAKFLLRFPHDTVDLFLSDACISHAQWNRFFVYLLRRDDGHSFRDYVKTQRCPTLIHLILGNYAGPLGAVGPPPTEAQSYEALHQAVLVVHTLMELDEEWIPTQTDIVGALKRLWARNLYDSCAGNVVCDLWHLVGRILLAYFAQNTHDIELLFQLLRALCLHFIPDFHFLREFLQNTVATNFTVQWKRTAFFHFVENFQNPALAEDVKAKIITAVLVPCFVNSFEKGEGVKLIGAAPAPYDDDDNNIVSVFIGKVFDPDRPFANDDSVRIALLQFACLLVEKASQHIHDGDSTNKHQGDKLRRLMTFAWPCLLSKSSVDPTARYHGHLLLAHIISRLAIHKKIVLQVFHSLLKGHAMEARPVVRQALDVLTPAMPLRMEDDNTMLTHWTKKIIVEEGHAMQQLFHILQLIVRHYKVYFPVRHHLVQHLINYMQRLGFPPNASMEHKKLSVDLAEVIIKWELQRIKEEERELAQKEERMDMMCDDLPGRSYGGGKPKDYTLKRPGSDDVGHEHRKRLAGVDLHTSLPHHHHHHHHHQPHLPNGPSGSKSITSVIGAGKIGGLEDPNRTSGIDKAHCDTVLNFLIRLACQVSDVQPGIVSSGESMSRRCVMLLKMAMRPEVWPQPFELKLNWLDKVFTAIETVHSNLNNICTGIEFLTFLLSILKPEQLLAIIRPIQKGLSSCIIHQNTRIVRLMHQFLTRLMSIFPPDMHHKHDDLEPLYSAVSTMIVDNLTLYEKSPTPNPSSLFGTLMVLKACCNNNMNYIDRILMQFIRVLNRLTKDHLAPRTNGTSTGGNGIGLLSTGPSTSAAAAAAAAAVSATSAAAAAASLSSGPTTYEGTHLALELLVLSLDLIKYRLMVMSSEVRKLFVNSILVSLIEKSGEAKILKCIVRMLDDWVRTKETPALNIQVPSIREKSVLLVKMMQNIEKKFADDCDLNTQFLELINYIYRDEYLKQTELTAKLEGAFLTGLRCPQPALRAKFFEVLDASMRRRLHDRLLYIICSQAWDAIGTHYWIKQCIELLVLTANTLTHIQNANEAHKVPNITSVINTASVPGPCPECSSFVIYMSSDDPAAFGADCDPATDDDREGDSFFDVVPHASAEQIGAIARRDDNSDVCPKRPAVLLKLINGQFEFLEVNRRIRTEQFLVAMSQLCHNDAELAESVWLAVFPRIWTIFDDDQQHMIARELVPFLASGTNVIQRDCQPSAINTFAEGLTHCDPPVELPPNLMTYLGRAHNLWHRMTLGLEEMCVAAGGCSTANLLVGGGGRSAGATCGSVTPDADLGDYEMVGAGGILTGGGSGAGGGGGASGSGGSAGAGGSAGGLGGGTATPGQIVNIYDGLSQMYSSMHEQDLWAGLWLKYAQYPETNIAIAYEQMGFFEEAQQAYDAAMTKFKQDSINGPVKVDITSELQLWETQWIRCAKELNQWDLLLDYARMNKEKNMMLILDSAWRVPDWDLMRSALTKTEHQIAKQFSYKVNLYKGYLAIVHREDPTVAPSVDRYIEAASGLCMREWRRLPHIVSHIHLPYLQAAQQIMELHEASQIHQGLCTSRASSLHDIKAIVKTWRNRLPVIADDLSHWNAIFTWRQNHYQAITAQLRSGTDMGNSIVGVHASVQAIIYFAKVARKHNLTGVCEETLSRIYTIPSVPVVDCFQSIRQQVKCYLHQANASGGKMEPIDALKVIETTNTKYFSGEMIAEFLALKGLLLSQIGRNEDAGKSFSSAVQLHNGLTKAWAMWGDYIEMLFLRDYKQTNLAVQALTCYLHACRHQCESKTRKYIAKVLWFLSYETVPGGPLMATLEKYGAGVPPSYWLPWMPQLLCCLMEYEGNVMLNLLSHVGRLFPQAVYFPLRTLYLTQKIEQREKHKTVAQAQSTVHIHVQEAQQAPCQQLMLHSASTSSGTSSVNPIKATPAMWRCSKLMHVLREFHPTILSSLEQIIDEMVCFRESWTEEVLRQLRQGLIKCYAIAFENRGAVSGATITPHTLHFVKKLGSTFGIGIENVPAAVTSSSISNSSNSASESLARRAQAIIQDPVFQMMKMQFTTDFDFTKPGAMQLHNLIGKLKVWIKVLEAKVKKLPISFLIEDKCRVLSNFSQKTAEVELPGEQLMPSSSHYHIRIARFMPRVEIVQKNNMAARRLYIRGTNGKVYPYLVVIDTGLSDARREERVLQLMRMLNHYLEKQKETASRFLNMTVPRVVPISMQMRLAEDNPASISLLEIYSNCCAKLKMDHDLPIVKYYERLADVQSRGTQTTHTVLCDIFNEVQATMVPKTLLKRWAVKSLLSATDFWHFRKMLTLQLALAFLCEYALHLTRLNVDMMYFHQDSGLMNVSYFKFDINEEKEELDCNRPVPFRLTPNIAEFITAMGITGPMSAAIVASARCFVQPNYKLSAILRTILRDEIIALHKKRMCDNRTICESEEQTLDQDTMDNVIEQVNKSVSAIMGRLQSLSQFEHCENKMVTQLIQSSINPDNLCRMDPAWHPWL